MGQKDGFLKFDRELPKYKAVEERVKDYKEFYEPFSEDKTVKQAARCMDCGIPFCHSGCPLGNIIPEFNDAVYRQDWKEAYDILSSTNNFPEFTGRICPAPCEGSCVLGINKPPVAIEHIEKSIIEEAFQRDWVKPHKTVAKTGKKIAVVGSGPAGMAAAAQLNKAGHDVVVFERAQKPGGLLRFGIPDFKLEKWVVERRIEVMEKSGIVFKCGVEVGVDIKGEDLAQSYDAIILACGASAPRDVQIPGRDLKGIYFAMDFLSQNNARVSELRHENHKGADVEELFATAKNVVVIGGGDTGSDCVGTSNRQGAESVTQFEINLKPPMGRDLHNPWPEWPLVLRTSSSHEEGCERKFSVLTKAFIGDDAGNVKAIKVAELEWVTEEGRKVFKEVPNTEREIPCDLALLAIGFLGPDQELAKQLNLDLDPRTNIQASEQDYKTSVDKVFACGDVRRGQSLVVWAISEGRECARVVDETLMGESLLEGKDVSHLAI